MTKKKILIINGHPDKESFNFGLAEAYKRGAISSGADVQEIVVRDLAFNPNLAFGYRKRTELEPDLLDAQQKIRWAEHLVCSSTTSPYFVCQIKDHCFAHRQLGMEL